MSIKRVNNLNELVGYWYLACVPNILYRHGELFFEPLFVRLGEKYKPSYMPFYWKSLPEENGKTLKEGAIIKIPIGDACSHYTGMIFKDGVPILEPEHEKFSILNLKFKGGFNEPKKLSLHIPDWILGSLEFPNEYGKCCYTALSEQQFEILGEDPPQITKVLIPSLEIIRYLYFRSSRLTQLFTDLTFNFSFLNEAGFFQDGEFRDFFISTTLNFQLEEFNIFASILCDPARRKHFDSFRTRIIKDFSENNGNASYQSYLPDHLKGLALSGTSYPLGKDKGRVFIAYHILEGDIEYPWRKLKVHADQDGRKGPNANDPNLPTVKKKDFIPSGDGSGEQQNDREYLSGGSVITSVFRVDTMRHPPVERLERGNQETRVEKNLVPTNNNNTTSRDQSGTDDDLPNKGSSELKDQKDEVKLDNNLLLFNKLFENLSQKDYLILKYENNIYRDFQKRDLADKDKRPYLPLFNSFNIEPDFTKEQRTFCKYYKNSRENWEGVRGLCILKISYGTKSVYALEIEPREMKHSINKFKLLIIYKSDVGRGEIEDETLNKILILCGRNLGVWQKCKAEIKKSLLEHALVLHKNDTFVNDVKKELNKAFGHQLLPLEEIPKKKRKSKKKKDKPE